MTFKETFRFVFCFSIFYFILNIITFDDDNKYIDSVCQFQGNDEQQGICKYITDCVSSTNDLINRNIKPQICAFDRKKLIVCCKINQSEIFESKILSVSKNITKMDEMINKINVDNDRKRISEIRCNFLHRSEVRKVYGKYHPRTTAPPTKRITKTDIVTENDSFSFANLQPTYPPKNERPLTTPIAGGKQTSYNEYPFMVALGWETFDDGIEFKCGGSLIESNFVVTAAHCINIGGAKPKIIRPGGVDIDKDYLTNEDIIIKNIFIHPNYTAEQNYNDIAIIQLKDHSIATPTCLYQDYEINSKYQHIKAIGYGQIQFAGPKSVKLLQIEIDFITNEQCYKYYLPEEKYPNGIIDSQICAIDPNKIQDTCPGDSGAPLFVKENIKPYEKVYISYILGITSFGKFCASETPGVYTRIFSYLDWIESIVWREQINL